MELNDKVTSANGGGMAGQAQGGDRSNGAAGANGHTSSAIVVTAPQPERPEKRESGGIALSRIAIQRPLLMLMAILAILVFGTIGYTRMGVDLFPSVNFPVVLVSIAYPGAGPDVVESLVTKPIEDAVSGL